MIEIMARVGEDIIRILIEHPYEFMVLIVVIIGSICFDNHLVAAREKMKRDEHQWRVNTIRFRRKIKAVRRIPKRGE